MTIFLTKGKCIDIRETTNRTNLFGGIHHQIDFIQLTCRAEQIGNLTLPFQEGHLLHTDFTLAGTDILPIGSGNLDKTGVGGGEAPGSREADVLQRLVVVGGCGMAGQHQFSVGIAFHPNAFGQKILVDSQGVASHISVTDFLDHFDGDAFDIVTRIGFAQDHLVAKGGLAAVALAIDLVPIAARIQVGLHLGQRDDRGGIGASAAFGCSGAGVIDQRLVGEGQTHVAHDVLHTVLPVVRNGDGHFLWQRSAQDQKNGIALDDDFLDCVVIVCTILHGKAVGTHPDTFVQQFVLVFECHHHIADGAGGSRRRGGVHAQSGGGSSGVASPIGTAHNQGMVAVGQCGGGGVFDTPVTAAIGNDGA